MESCQGTPSFATDGAKVGLFPAKAKKRLSVTCKNLLTEPALRVKKAKRPIYAA